MQPVRPFSAHFDWAPLLAADIAAARGLVSITSLSLQTIDLKKEHPLSLLWRAVSFAVSNGTDVCFYLPQPSKSHPATAYNLSAAAALQRLGAKFHLVPVTNLLHMKSVVIDGSLIWIGSGNWTRAACAHNHECYARMISSDDAALLLAKHVSLKHG